MRLSASLFLVLAAFTAAALSYSHYHTGDRRTPYRSSVFSRSMDERNRVSARLRRAAPEMAEEEVREAAEEAAAKYRSTHGVSRRRKRDVEGDAANACNGEEEIPTEENACDANFEPECGEETRRYRTTDGTCNNPNDARLGSTNTLIKRLVPAFYRDGLSMPFGGSALNFRVEEEHSEEGVLRRRKREAEEEAEDRHSRWGWWGWKGSPKAERCDETFPNQLPEPRTVSTNFHRDVDSPDQKVSLMVMQFGQFLDHDITLTPEAELDQGVDCCEVTEDSLEENSGVCLGIPLPPGDKFAEDNDLTCLEFRRSTAFCEDPSKVREQFNIITHFVDTSNIYASDPPMACSLRCEEDGCLLNSRTDVGSEYLPCMGAENRLTSGDIRALEMPGLATMHTLWLREHNLIAEQIRRNVQGLTSQQVFQEARRILNGIYQNVVYSGFLPVVVGPEEMYKRHLSIRGPTRYFSKVDPSILNVFATAAYRFGHTLIQGTIVPRDVGSKNELESYMLRNNFFNDSLLDETLSNGGVDRIITGIAEEQAQEFDQFVTTEVTNFLQFDFGSEETDLIARNLQRSRDHGLPGYNEFREFCDLPPACSWDRRPQEISSAVWRELSMLYNHPNDIEPFTGGLAENPVKGGVVGPTFACIIAEQFKRLRFGDRFFFTHGWEEGSFNWQEMAFLRKQRLSDVMCRNVPGLSSLREDVFLLTGSQVDCDDASRPGINLSRFFGPHNPVTRLDGVTVADPWVVEPPAP